MAISIISTNSIDDIKKDWLELEKYGVESPAHSFEFIKSWVNILNIAPKDQYYSVVKIDNKPIILMALERVKIFGIYYLIPFTRYHVGIGAPLVNEKYLAGISANERKKLWQAAIEPFDNISFIYFPYVPHFKGRENIYRQMGFSAKADFLFRAQFNNWQDCDKKQRNRSRRKHDKQHGKKLNALGKVEFSIIGSDNSEFDKIIELMFEQRAKRFASQGIKNPFESKEFQQFYRQVGKKSKNIKCELHILRLNDEIIAVRYNIIHQKKIFCLISSMSDDKTIQRGAPGKQNLLNIMQRIFDEGYEIYDMGAGLTDEKRQWCNVKIPLHHYYIALNFAGFIITNLHKLKKSIRFRVKNSKNLGNLLKKLRRFGYRLFAK